MRRTRWLTADGRRPPASVLVVDDDLSADRACRLAADGVGLLWRGDHHNARTLLDAMARRIDRAAARRPVLTPSAEFRRMRQHRARRSRLLGAVLVELGADHVLALHRAPSVAAACREVYGPAHSPAVLALRELIGVIGAHRWRTGGIEVPALGARIHPHYGVFAPTRTDYVDLVARAPLPPTRTTFDIGTGTGVLAALLLSRGVPTVVATDVERRAVDCAQENLHRLGYGDRSAVLQRHLFPPGRADLVVCNPPWIPGSPTSSLEAGIFDRRSTMLTAFVRGLPDHLTERGEAWLVVSDLPELLGLRGPGLLQELLREAGLVVRGRLGSPPSTRGGSGRGDPIADLRRQESITLWRLVRQHTAGRSETEQNSSPSGSVSTWD